jgi:hypothetical protein
MKNKLISLYKKLVEKIEKEEDFKKVTSNHFRLYFKDQKEFISMEIRENIDMSGKKIGYTIVCLDIEKEITEEEFNDLKKISNEKIEYFKDIENKKKLKKQERTVDYFLEKLN